MEKRNFNGNKKNFKIIKYILYILLFTKIKYYIYVIKFNYLNQL